MSFDPNTLSGIYQALQNLGGAPTWPAGDAEADRIEKIASESSLMQLVEEFLQEAHTMPIASRFSGTKPPYNILGKEGERMSQHRTEEGHKRAQLESDLRRIKNALERVVYNLKSVRLDMLATGLEDDGTPAQPTTTDPQIEDPR